MQAPFVSTAQQAPSSRCSLPHFVSSEDGHVHNVTVLGHPRCFTVVASGLARRRRPVLPALFFFHGYGGSGLECGTVPDRHGHTLASLALKLDFVLVCAEARRRNGSNSFLWHIPMVQTDLTGTSCADSQDEKYLIEMFARLPPFVDKSAVSLAGSSLGAAFALFAATCCLLSEPLQRTPQD